MTEDQTIALAGMFQAASLVITLAQAEHADDDALETSLRSVFMIDAADVAAVYDGVGGLKLGFRTVLAQLETPRRDFEPSRLVLAMMQLERRLARSPETTHKLGQGIEAIRRQLDHFGPLHETVQVRLGELYEETLSTLRPRVMVHGNPHVLAQPAHAARIRAALLAGIRSAVLWHQIGGRRWRLLLQRGQLIMLARGILSRTTLDMGS